MIEGFTGIRRVITATLATVFLGAAMIGITPTASADNPLCPANAFCLFKDANYSGGRWIYGTGLAQLSAERWDTGGSVDNSASSLINNTSRYFQLHDKYYIPCLARMFRVEAETEIPDLSRKNWDYPTEDRNKPVNNMVGCVVGF